MHFPPRPCRIASIGCQQHLSCPHLPASLSTSSLAGLVHGKVDMPTPLNLFTTSSAADRLPKGPMSRRLVQEGAAKIGKASVRCRVLQNVYDLVVTLTIKKKKMKN